MIHLIQSHELTVQLFMSQVRCVRAAGEVGESLIGETGSERKI